MLEFWEVSFIRISATSLSHCRENTRVAFLLKRNLKAHRIVCKLISVIPKSFIMSRSVQVVIIRTIVCLMHPHNFFDMRSLQFYFGHKLLYSTVSNETPLYVRSSSLQSDGQTPMVQTFMSHLCSTYTYHAIENVTQHRSCIVHHYSSVTQHGQNEWGLDHVQTGDSALD